MSQQFSSALIIEFMETFNREVKENSSFLSNVSNWEHCYLQTFYYHKCEVEQRGSYDKDYYKQHESWEKEDLLY